jgi:hydrogenase nickel incorporation protein HypA/HybF
MHESRLMQDLKGIVLTTLEHEGAVRASRASIWLGALCPISEEHLREHWSQVFTGTPAERCELRFTRSKDLTDPKAQSLVLLSLDVEERSPGAIQNGASVLGVEQ